MVTSRHATNEIAEWLGAMLADGVAPRSNNYEPGKGLGSYRRYRRSIVEAPVRHLVSSLKELTQRQLQDLDRKMKQRANA